jgi:hypothetical protein
MQMYDTATLVLTEPALLKVETNSTGTHIFVPKAMLLEATPVGIGDTPIRHNVRLKDGTVFTARILK